MTFLPIVTRELRVAARRRSTYWMRSGAALLVVAIGAYLFLAMSRERPQILAKVLFGLIAGGACLYALLSGVRSTADCLSQEKREGTLGLLFLTDLKGYDVVLGKLVSNSVNSFYGVVAVVPMMAIPLLLGGVTGGEVARMAVASVNTLFFSLCVGMAVSSISRNAQKAAGGTFGVIAFLAAGLPALAGVLEAAGKAGPLVRAFLWPSAGYSYAMAFDATYRNHSFDFWISVAAVQAMGWAALGLASLCAPSAWQDRPIGVSFWRGAGQGGSRSGRSAQFRRRCLDASAFFWLTARVRHRPLQVWLVLGIMGAGWLFGFLQFRGDWLNEGVYLFTAGTLNLLVRAWFASEASRQLAEERKAGTLELLLSTPLTVRDILRGQLLALERQFLAPVVFVLGVNVILMLATLSETAIRPDRAFWTCVWLGMMVMVVADLVALYWVGMWQGIANRNIARVSSATAAPVLVIPWLFMAIIILARFQRSMQGGGDPTWQFMFGWWLGIGLATDLILSVWSRMRLLNEFREVASRRYAPPVSFWSRFFHQHS